MIGARFAARIVAEEENVNYIQNEMQKKTVSNCASE